MLPAWRTALRTTRETAGLPENLPVKTAIMLALIGTVKRDLPNCSSLSDPKPANYCGFLLFVRRQKGNQGHVKSVFSARHVQPNAVRLSGHF